MSARRAEKSEIVALHFLVRWDSVPFRGLGAPYTREGKLQPLAEGVNACPMAPELEQTLVPFPTPRFRRGVSLSGSRFIERAQRELGGVATDSPFDPLAMTPLNLLYDRLHFGRRRHCRIVALVRLLPPALSHGSRREYGTLHYSERA